MSRAERQGFSRIPLLANGTNRGLWASPDPLANVSPWCLCCTRDETSLACTALHCGGQSFINFPLLRGELCPASIVWPRSSGCRCNDRLRPQVLPLCCARIRYGNRSLSEPRSRAKSARPTPIVAFRHNTTNFYQATLSVQGLHSEKISCPIAVQLGAVRNLETASASDAGGRPRTHLLLQLAWPRLSSGSDA